MGRPELPQPVTFICGILAAQQDYLAPARAMLEARFGPVEASSAAIPFKWTNYYKEEMGEDVVRQFVSFREPFEPSLLAQAKLETNRCEKELAETLDGTFSRPVNLDPGYIDAARLVLATTKDNAHRIYLRDGIYAEITLSFIKGAFRPLEWTYPDYRSEEYRDFLTRVRSEHMRKSRRHDAGDKTDSKPDRRP